MVKKKVIIFGISGQDGYYLSKKLDRLNFNIYGISRNAKKIKTNQKNKIYPKKIRFISKNICDYKSVYNTISKIKPYLIYNLTNIHSLKYSYDKPINTYESVFNGNLNILESILKIDKSIKFFSASSCEIFGNNLKGLVSEKTTLKPNNHYGQAKKEAFELVKFYRERFNLSCSSGILFNHESIIREDRYLPIRLINDCIKLKKNKINKITVNNLFSKCDWGWAPDYVDAIYKISSKKIADDFIIASGNTYSVLDLVKIIFQKFDLNYKNYLNVENHVKSIARNTKYFKADTSKIYEKLNWKTNKNLSYIIDEIIKSKIND